MVILLLFRVVGFWVPHKLRSRLNQMYGEGSADLRSSRHFIQSQEITVVMS